jgi:hypothetical protein
LKKQSGETEKRPRMAQEGKEDEEGEEKEENDRKSDVPGDARPLEIIGLN